MFLALIPVAGGIRMWLAGTEETHVSAWGFDLRPAGEALDILAAAQFGAAWAVRSALPAIAEAAEMAASAMAGGGTLAYAAAGSSALMAMADGLELPGTYGIPKERIKILIAGGLEALTGLVGGPEDAGAQAVEAVAAAGLKAGDCLVAVS